MRIIRVLPMGAAGLALCFSSFAWGQENVHRARQAQQLMQQNNISLADAIRQAEQECDGRVVSAHVRVIPGNETAPQSADRAATGGQLQFVVTCYGDGELRTLLVDQLGQVRPAPEAAQPGREMSDAREMRASGRQTDSEQPLRFQEEQSGRRDGDRERRESHAAREREWGRTVTPPPAEGALPPGASVRLRTQRFSELEDTDVLNPEDRKLGDIEDLAIDPTTGDVKYAVLSYGGFLDMGDKLFAIPYQALHVRNDQTIVLNVPEDRIKDAPGFDKNAWPNMANPAFATEVDTYYRSAGYADGSMRTRTVARTDLTTATRIARGKHDIMGKKIVGNQDAVLGTIDDLIIDPDRTKVAYVIVTAGGMLGMGATKYAIPWNALSSTAADQSYRVNMDAEHLKQIRGFTGEQWPDMTDRNWAVTTHRFFNVQPYWEAPCKPLPPREQRMRDVEFDEEPEEIG